MKRCLASSFLCLLLAGCSSQRTATEKALSPKAYGAQIVEVSGGKQYAAVGSDLPQPIVVQVNGADGNPVTGALVSFRGDGLQFKPAQVLSDTSGQVTTTPQLGFAPGDYRIIAETPKSGGGNADLALRASALGYEETLGKAVAEKYCIRCHDRESTPERVSNFDNLSPAPHALDDGAFLNNIAGADLMKIITQGGPALSKSPSMPAFGSTVKPAEIKAVVAYIRAIADPPYQAPGAKK